mmetsp:Transcript_87965/g.273702  ORF Transcript_87965/g.273702 Transcript_87965/m.273702 type:complete len:238 (-) Transcript_87965:73-786(-)
MGGLGTGEHIVVCARCTGVFANDRQRVCGRVVLVAPCPLRACAVEQRAHSVKGNALCLVRARELLGHGVLEVLASGDQAHGRARDGVHLAQRRSQPRLQGQAVLGVQAPDGRQLGLEGQELPVEGFGVRAVVLHESLQGGSHAAGAGSGQQGRARDAEQLGRHGRLPMPQGAEDDRVRLDLLQKAQRPWEPPLHAHVADLYYVRELPVQPVLPQQLRERLEDARLGVDVVLGQVLHG